MQFHGKVALVTGGSRGIGRAVAVELAQKGALVYCTSTKDGGCAETIAQIAALPAGSGQGRALVADVSSPSSAEQLAKTVLESSGQLDFLVNNAGITRDGLFLRMSAEDFDAVIDIGKIQPFRHGPVCYLGFDRPGGL